MSGDVRIGVLGPLTVEVDGVPIELSSPSQRIVLLRLVVADGTPVGTDALADALWGEDLPENPANAVRYHVWKLRDAIDIEDAITTVSGGYQLSVSPDAIDAHRFADLATDDDPMRLDAALELWRGTPLADAGDHEFAQPERRRLEELHAGLLRRRAAALVDAGRTGEAIPELERLIAADPYDESLWSSLMKALYAEGRQADALAAFTRAKEALGEGLGLEPSPELVALEEQVLLHGIDVVDTSTTTNLPPSLTTFVGRQAELDEVVAMIQRHRLVSIVGVGGGGKTRLATEAGRRSLGSGTSVLFVDLTPARSGDDLYTVVGSAMGLDLDDPDVEPRTEVTAALGRRKTLALVDNAEHLLDEVAVTVAELINHCPDLRVLITSRAPLRIPGERVFQLPALTEPTDDATWDALAATDAGALLLDRFSDAGVSIDRTDDALGHLISICRALEGLPLAIELVAARAAVMPLGALDDALDSGLEAFGSQRSLTERHRTMDATINWSYQLLDPTTRSVFRRISVFVGGFTTDAAVHLLDDLSSGEVAEALRALVEQSLVHLVPGTDRYRQLEPFRQFGLQLLDDAGESEAVERAHADAFHDIAVASVPEQRAGARNEIFTGFTEEAPNFRRALEFFQVTGDTGRLCALAAALTTYWMEYDRVEDQRRWSEACLTFIDESPDAVAITLMFLRGFCVARDTTSPEGVGMVERAVALADETGNELLWADMVVWVQRKGDFLGYGVFALGLEDIERSQRALDIYEAHEDQWGVVAALGTMSSAVSMWQGKPVESREYAVRSEQLARQIDDPIGEIWAISLILSIDVGAAVEAGEVPAYDEARIDRMVALAPGISTDWVCHSMHGVAWGHYRQGAVREAAIVMARAAVIADDAGSLYHSVASHTGLAVFLEDLDRDAAVRSLVVGIDRALTRAVDRQTVWVIEVAARFLPGAGHPEVAARCLGAADQQRKEARSAMPVVDVARYEETVEAVRAADPERFEEHHAEGMRMTITEAAEAARLALVER